MATAYRRLGEFPLFEGVEGKQLARLEQACQWQRYNAGKVIFDRGATTRDLFLVAEGRVRVVNYSYRGREVSFADVEPGGYVGEFAAIDGLPRAASVRAVTDVLLAVLPGDTFVEVLRSNASLSFALLERLVFMIRGCDERIMDLSTLGATQRVYAELLRLSEPDAAVPGLWVVKPCPTEREIASRVGTARETVDRAIRQLRFAGLVRRKDRKLYLMDKAKLEAITQALDAQGRS